MTATTPNQTRASAPRRGAIVWTVILSLVMVALLGMVLSFAWFSLCYENVRTACEAAALAGASQLMDDSVLYPADRTPPPTAQRIAQAKTVALDYLTANLDVEDANALRDTVYNVANSAQGGLVAGWCEHPSLLGAPIVPWHSADWPAGQPVNALLVRLGPATHRGSKAGTLSSRLFGFLTPEATAEAAAVVDQRILGFRPAGPTRVPMMPFVVTLPAGADSWRGKASTGPDDVPKITLCFAPETPARPLGRQADSGLRPHASPAGDAGADASRSPRGFGSMASQDEARPTLRVLALSEIMRDEPHFARVAQTGFTTADLDSLGGEIAAGRRVRALIAPNDKLDFLAATLLQTAGKPKIWPVGTPDAGRECVIERFVAGRVIACEIVEQDDGRDELRVVVEPCLIQTATAIVGPRATEHNPWIGKLVLVR